MRQIFSGFFWRLAVAWALFGAGLVGCVTEPETVQSATQERPAVLLIGRAMTVLTGERARKFEPTVREIEFINRDDGTRYRVSIGGSDTLFAALLPPGRYDVNRVQINEGPFLSIAQPALSIALNEGPVVFSGTWRFGVDSPKYGRMVALSVMVDEESQTLLRQKVQTEYPTLASSPVMTTLPVPTEVQTRLYEVAPYPRVSRYFRRHYW
ncbi:MAG: hypothetical protein KIT40_17645 [Nitrospira sp.]|nr:hypothetical protein [Nitrospira sp.]